MTKIYDGPNQRNLVSGFLQTMFVDLIREQEDEKGPAKETEKEKPVRREGPHEFCTAGQVV